MEERGSQRIFFRASELGPDLEARLRGSLTHGLVTKRDLGRYYWLLKGELSSIGLTRDEACAVCDACNATAFDPEATRFIWAEIADAEDTCDKWGVDQAALVQKLRALTRVQSLALADAIERFWVNPHMDTDQALRKVGLIPDDEA